MSVVVGLLLEGGSLLSGTKIFILTQLLANPIAAFLYTFNHCVRKFDRKAEALDIAGKTTLLPLSSQESNLENDCY